MDSTLIDVPGIGADRAKALAEHGIGKLEELAAASVDRIAAVPGFGPVSARRSKQAAVELVTSSEPSRKAEKKGKKGRRKDKSAKKSGKGGKKGKRKSGKKDKKGKKRKKKRRKK